MCVASLRTLKFGKEVNLRLLIFGTLKIGNVNNELKPQLMIGKVITKTRHIPMLRCQIDYNHWINMCVYIIYT